MTLRVQLFLTLLIPCTLLAATAKLPVIKDTGVSTERGHQNDNSGASVSVPIRQNQNWQGFETKAWLGQFDMSAVKGWTVKEAWLNLYLPKGNLYGLGLCTVLADWAEGGGMNGETGEGGASWTWASEPKDPLAPDKGNLWSWPGSGVYSVSWYHPDARYQHIGPAEIQRDSLQAGQVLHLRVPVSPKLVESLAEGFSYGLILTDDKGQVAEGYSLHGAAVPYAYDHSQDIYMFTRDVQDPALRPFLEVEGGPADKTAPGQPGQLAVTSTEPYDPSVTVEFAAPGEDGPAGAAVLGYDVRWSKVAISADNWSAATRLPLWMVPKPAAPGTRQRIRVFDLPAGSYYLALRAVDEAGNHGPLASVKIEIPAPPQTALADNPAIEHGGQPENIIFDDMLEIWACPDLCKVDPVDGGILLDGINYAQDESYKRDNPAWASGRRTVYLEAAHGEVAAFQLLLGRVGQSKLSNVRVTLSNLSGDPDEIKALGNISLSRVWYLDAALRQEELLGPGEREEKMEHKAAWHGDACLPLEAPFDAAFSLPATDNVGEKQRWQSVWVDLNVPTGVKPGTYQGRITVTAAELPRPAILILMLKVLPFNIPAQVTWPIDLNAYAYGITSISGISIDSSTQRYLNVERSYYQVGHANRATLNILPYNQDGSVQMLAAPVLTGEGAGIKVSDWKDWDERYGPYLTGKAFTPAMGYRGPWPGQPLTHIYLPFHENWPLPIKGHYGDYAELKTRLQFADWAKTSRDPFEAFDSDYKKGFSSVVRQFFEHFEKKGYTGTAFQVYFNNKYYFKVPFFKMRNEGSGSSFWLLDEPVDYDDYEANRFYMQLVRDGFAAWGKKSIRLDLRTDVSQPELTRGLWDGLCNLWDDSGLFGCASSAMFRMRRLPGEKSWKYGGAPRVDGKLIQMQETFLSLWAIGATGALPYWNSLGGGDWHTPDDLSVYYTGNHYAGTDKTYDGAIPGVRLKIIRRAEQDIEYLNLLADKSGWSELKLQHALAPYADDPKAWPLTFFKLDASGLERLRRDVAGELSK